MKILVGCGPSPGIWRDQGWTTNDIQAFEGVDMVGPCWALPVPDASVDEVFAKGMLEHLTYEQVVLSFVEWKRVLKPGGFFTAEAPDAEEYLTEYCKMKTGASEPTGEGGGHADGEPDDEDACSGIDRWLRRALWGWQRWPGDEHRSGWTMRLFSHYIARHFGGTQEIRRMAISFDEDVPVSRVRHLWARAWKEGVVDDEIKDEVVPPPPPAPTDMPHTRFQIQPPFIIFHDDKPGAHATLFAPNGRRLPFRGDASNFDDARRHYAWAFEGGVKDGDVVVFATADREVVGKVRDGAIELVQNTGGVSRESGKPIDLQGTLLPPIEALLLPPHQESRERPWQMTRPVK